MNDTLIEDRDTRRRRLLFRARHRGMQETDVILGEFAEAWLDRMTPDQWDRFEALLEAFDVDLVRWIFGQEVPPPQHDHDVMALILRFKLERLERK